MWTGSRLTDGQNEGQRLADTPETPHVAAIQVVGYALLHLISPSAGCILRYLDQFVEEAEIEDDDIGGEEIRGGGTGRVEGAEEDAVEGGQRVDVLAEGDEGHHQLDRGQHDTDALVAEPEPTDEGPLVLDPDSSAHRPVCKPGHLFIGIQGICGRDTQAATRELSRGCF